MSVRLHQWQKAVKHSGHLSRPRKRGQQQTDPVRRTLWLENQGDPGRISSFQHRPGRV